MDRKTLVNLFVFANLLFFISCNMVSGESKYPTIPGYELYQPLQVKLKTELDEISGILFYPKDTSVFAVNDEFGVLYKIFIRNRVTIDEFKFADNGDYEDLALVDSTFFALKSNGDITSFRFYSKDSMEVKEHDFPLGGKPEFETLYLDTTIKKLVLICKDCKGNKEQVNAYSFDPSSLSYNTTPLFTINAKAVLDHLEGEEKEFKPSAAAIHPITGELYIISSVNKALVIADREGNVIEVCPLSPSTFKQPEGLNFKPNGDLLISNESADVGAGNILIYKYKPKDK